MKGSISSSTVGSTNLSYFHPYLSLNDQPKIRLLLHHFLFLILSPKDRQSLDWSRTPKYCPDRRARPRLSWQDSKVLPGDINTQHERTTTFGVNLPSTMKQVGCVELYILLDFYITSVIRCTFLHQKQIIFTLILMLEDRLLAICILHLGLLIA